jgi:hypothetical protein
MAMNTHPCLASAIRAFAGLRWAASARHLECRWEVYTGRRAGRWRPGTQDRPHGLPR